MKVVIDCNVLVSAARVDGVCRAVIDTVVRQHEIVLSKRVLAEYEAVAARPKQAPYRDALRANSSEMKRLTMVVEPADIAFGLRDPDDEIYLATATAGGAVLSHRQPSRLHGATIRVGRRAVSADLPRPNDMSAWSVRPRRSAGCSARTNIGVSVLSNGDMRGESGGADTGLTPDSKRARAAQASLSVVERSAPRLTRTRTRSTSSRGLCGAGASPTGTARRSPGCRRSAVR